MPNPDADANPAAPSPIKRVYSPYHAQSVAFGLLRSKKPLGLFLHNYLTLAPLPTAPRECDWSTKAIEELLLLNGNNTLGDCFVAGVNKTNGIWTANAGSLYIAPLPRIIIEYSAISGYVPGVPSTDIGCDPVVGLQYYMTHGFGNGDRIAGALAIDVTQPGWQVLFEQGIDLFEGGGLGYELPSDWTNPLPAGPGFVWGMAGPPDPTQGHWTVVTGYTPQGVTINSWGLQGTVTYDAVAYYCSAASAGLCYIICSQASVSKAQQKSPDGINWPALLADWATLAASPIVISP